jgi:hypothetical protein
MTVGDGKITATGRTDCVVGMVARELIAREDGVCPRSHLDYERSTGRTFHNVIFSNRIRRDAWACSPQLLAVLPMRRRLGDVANMECKKSAKAVLAT